MEFKIIYPECEKCQSKDICDRYIELTGKQFCPRHKKSIQQTKLF